MNKKNILIYMIIVILIIIVLISCILINLNNNTQTPIDISESNNKIEEQKVTDNSKFYTVADCISRYLSEINKNNPKYYGTAEDGNYEKIVKEQDIKQNIYTLLSEDYINNNNITINNVYNYVYDITKQVIFVPIEMKYISLDTIEKYVAHGFILNEENKLIKEICIGVNLQLNDNVFSVEQYKDNVDINDIKITKEQNVIKNADNNSFKYVNVTDEYLIKQYLNTYKRLVVAKPEMSYNILDEEYRKNKFANFEEYEKYIEKNNNKIKTASISKYQKTSRSNYVRIYLFNANRRLLYI